MTQKTQKGNKNKDISTLVLCILVSLAVSLTLLKGGWQLTYSGLTRAIQIFDKVWAPLLLGFLLGGCIQVLIPRPLVSKWLGADSGIKGILIGSYVSIFVSGGPYVWMPVVASIYKSGAGVGPVIAMITARGILSFQMLIVWQFPFFGAELSMARYLPCLLVPPLVGLLGNGVLNLLKWKEEPIKEDDSSKSN